MLTKYLRFRRRPLRHPLPQEEMHQPAHLKAAVCRPSHVPLWLMTWPSGLRFGPFRRPHGCRCELMSPEPARLRIRRPGCSPPPRRPPRKTRPDFSSFLFPGCHLTSRLSGTAAGRALSTKKTRKDRRASGPKPFRGHQSLCGVRAHSSDLRLLLAGWHHCARLSALLHNDPSQEQSADSSTLLARVISFARLASFRVHWICRPEHSASITARSLSLTDSRLYHLHLQVPLY